jgi:hypothetical protein
LGLALRRFGHVCEILSGDREKTVKFRCYYVNTVAQRVLIDPQISNVHPAKRWK